jgi:hemerythrin-like domain-containing protein
MLQAVETMKDRHNAMLWTLLAVRRMIRRALQSAIKPDFRELRRLTSYLEHFPEKLHQPNEEQYLFRAVEAREPGLARTIARLRRDHAAMIGYGDRLRTNLGYWEQGDPRSGSQSAMIVDDYARFCLRHVRAEQRELLPAALEVLSEKEWSHIDRAFASVADSLAASKTRPDRDEALMQL